MVERKHVKPKEGIVVYDPTSKTNLPPEGKEVNFDSYYIRRAMEGSITVTDPDPMPAKKKGPVRAEKEKEK